MKNRLKINIIILIIFSATFSMFFLQKNMINKNSAHAASEKTYNYVISNLSQSPNIISLSGKYADDSNYLISETIIDLNVALNLIEEDLALDSKSLLNTKVTIYFNNFIIYNSWTLNLSYGTIEFSGTIANPFLLPTFEITATNDNNFSFKDLIISSSSNKIIVVNESTHIINLKIINSSFESNATHSYAVYFENTPCFVTLSKSNNHTSSYLFNYHKSLTIICEDFEESNLKITLPSNLNNEPVLRNITSIITQSISFYSENDTYSIEGAAQWYSKILFYSSKINLNTNTNGGSCSETIANAYDYGKNFDITTALQKTDNYFAGWFGYLTLDSNVYYFDSQMLKTVADANFEKQAIISNFCTSLNEVKNSSSFNKFFDSSDLDNLTISDNFIALFESMNQIPSLIAKWEYEIILNTLDENPQTSVKFSIDTIASIKNAIREGYSFDGWFRDQDLTIPCNFSEIKTNTTIYARWKINSYKITFYENFDALNPIYSETLIFNNPINFPVITKIGHHIDRWITSDNSEFSSSKMIGKDISIYAVWKKNTYVTYFETQSIYIAPIHSLYLESIDKPETPTRIGYSFAGWIDKETNQPFDFSTTPAKESRTAVAKWSANSYIATFNFLVAEEKLIAYGETITYVPSNPGFKLIGWYNSENELVKTMPAKNISLYPKWQQKNIVSITLKNQSNSIDSTNRGYKLNSNLSNFVVEYYIDGNWTTEIPSSAGTFDVRVTRLEDDNYAAFCEILPNGYQILPTIINLDIIISILLICFFIEIVFIIIIRWLMSQKKSAPITYAIILPFAMFDTTEFVVLIIASILVIIGLIWIIKDLIVLHNIIPDPTPENKYDNRITISKIEDSSNDIDIEQKVDDFLAQNNLIEKNKKYDKIKTNNDEPDDY